LSADLLLVILGLFGSGALAFMAFALGFNKNATFSDEQQIKDLLGAYAPDCQAKAIAIAQDRKSALVRSSDNRLFLLSFLGARPVLRSFSQRDIKTIQSGHVRIDLGDLGFPALDFRAAQAHISSALGKSDTQGPP
jgi:hypothetical protein